MVTTKYHSRISDVSNYSSIKFYLRIRSTDGNSRDCVLLICAFIISDVTQSIVVQFVQKPLKNNIFRFSVVFSRRIDDYAKNGRPRDSYVVFTMSLCTRGLKQLLISLLFQIIRL